MTYIVDLLHAQWCTLVELVDFLHASDLSQHPRRHPGVGTVGKGAPIGGKAFASKLTVQMHLSVRRNNSIHKGTTV